MIIIIHIRICLYLQGGDAAVDVLEDVVLGDGEEVVDGGDVVDGVGEDAHLVHPRVAEHLDVLLRNLAPRPRRQDPRGVDHLILQGGQREQFLSIYLRHNS